jgi:hypothetical protein
MRVSRAKVERYNEAIKQCQARVRSLTGAGPDFDVLLRSVISVRLVLVLGCLLLHFSPFQQLQVAGYWPVVFATLAIAALAPYSIVVAFTCFLTNAQEALLHYASCFVVAQLIPDAMVAGPVLITSPLFIACFFLVDQSVCLLVYLYNNDGSVKLTLSRVAFGFINTKTYYLILWLATLNSPVHVPRLVLASFVSAILQRHVWPHVQRGLNIPPFPALFYNQHRLGHLPGVYQCAHKFHHVLHDTTAFDAHVYGFGLPEESVWLLLEVVMLLCFKLPPYTLNITTLFASWDNKFGHTREVLDTVYKGTGNHKVNHHADHHTLHSKNFGSEWGVPMEMIMGTNSDCDTYQWYEFELKRAVEGDNYVVTCTPNKKV